MLQLPPLQITDQQDCRFYLFDNLQSLWKMAAGHGQSHRNILYESRQVAEIMEDNNEVNVSDTSVLAVVDEHVWSLHKEQIKKTFPEISTRFFILPSGEKSKSVGMWSRLLDFVFSGSVRRNTPFVAIGGGVTGDLAGFAASSLLRGLPLYHVPTTLLAMVDSAIGGKTGINHAFGKNTIGSFYQPEAVMFDLSFLDTLPQREWLCGLSEVIKYGYISNPMMLMDAARLADPRTRNEALLQQVIEQSVRIKTSIVAEDARESGKRSWLNFGHTFAHALETLDLYKNINHGEAVFTGMIAALYVSRKLGYEVTDEHLVGLKQVYNLKPAQYTSSVDKLVTLMNNDKKNRDKHIRLVLLQTYGKPVIHALDEPALLAEAWRYTFKVLHNN